MLAGQRRSTEVTGRPAGRDVRAPLRALWTRHKMLIIAIALFLFLDLIVAFGVAGSAGHF